MFVIGEKRQDFHRCEVFYKKNEERDGVTHRQTNKYIERTENSEEVCKIEHHQFFNIRLFYQTMEVKEITLLIFFKK